MKEATYSYRAMTYSTASRQEKMTNKESLTEFLKADSHSTVVKHETYTGGTALCVFIKDWFYNDSDW